jgi:hypothetical protein
VKRRQQRPHNHILTSDHWVITLQIADPSSRQRGRPTEGRPQFSDSNIPTGSNIWPQVPQGCSISRHTDWLTVTHKVIPNSEFPGGMLEYLRRSHVSHERPRKGHPVPRGISGHPFPGGYKFRDLVLQVGGVSYETLKYGRDFCGTCPKNGCSGRTQNQLHE